MFGMAGIVETKRKNRFGTVESGTENRLFWWRSNNLAEWFRFPASLE
jgi:hypothetical protein